MDLPKQMRRTGWICAALGAATLAAYWPVTGCAFLNYDDNVFVSQNAQVAGGLSWASVAWAFRTGVGGNWQPLTWLSHMLDAQLFGLNPGWHHLTNLLFHTANGVLLFLLLQRLTGAAWRSALVAALFALHPLHVESVAWVAERKDVLSGFFFLLTLWAYARYAEGRMQNAECRMRNEETACGSPSSFILHPAEFYVLSLSCFALGLMSKPMLVTVPFVLLLLDYWPLRRMQKAEGRMQKGEADSATRNPQPATRNTPPHAPRPTPYISRLLREKLPFFALAAVSCVVTFAVQRASEAVYPLADLPLTQRAINALVAYATYLAKTVWPSSLAVFYPLPETVPVIRVIAAGAVVFGITVWAVQSARRRPHVAVGWFWFMGMLVPVIGLVQVGLQARADRYTYLPLVGVFILVIWEAADRVAALGTARPAFAARALCSIGVGLVLVAFGLRSRGQLRHWQNSESLFRQAIAVTPGNWLAHYNLGEALRDLGRSEEAAAEYRRAVAIHPNYSHAHNNLANLLYRQGQVDEAIAHWQKALEIAPNTAASHNNLGGVLLSRGRVDEAVAHLRKAIEIEPGLVSAHNSLGNALMQKGRLDEAIGCFEEAVRLCPDVGKVRCNLGAALVRKGRVAEALVHYEAAIAVQSPNASVLAAVAWVLATCPEAGVRNGARAVELSEQARRLPAGENAAVLGTLAAAYAEAGRFAEAVAAAQRALALAAAQANFPQAEALRAQLAFYQAGSPFRDQSLSPRAK